MDDTMASAAQDRLEEILRRLKAAGGTVISDEKGPLHYDFNNEVVEIGEQRVVEVNFNKIDFQITHQIKNYHAGGGGHRKHLEKLTRPIIETKLKRKPETSDQWIGVDIEDMF